MTSHKIVLGNFIYSSIINNRDLMYDHEFIRGVTTEGIMSGPKGDVTDVDLKPYKIVQKNAFVYNPSRLDLGSIAICEEELCIVSHLYIVFYLNELGLKRIDPSWLFMYIRRKEFLREVTFRNYGSQRPEFNFKKMSEIELLLPPIEVQRKYVAVYEAMLANQRSYERGLDDLKLACDGNIEELMREHRHEPIGPYISEFDKRNGDAYGLDSVKGISSAKEFIHTKANMDGVRLNNYKIVEPGMLAYVPDTSRRGDKISLALNEDNEAHLVSSISQVFKTEEGKLLPEYLMLFFSRSEFDRYARFNSWGSARETFSWRDMQDVKIPIPDIKTQRAIADIFKVYRQRSEINERLKAQLKDLCPILIKGSIDEARAS